MQSRRQRLLEVMPVHGGDDNWFVFTFFAVWILLYIVIGVLWWRDSRKP